MTDPAPLLEVERRAFHEDVFERVLRLTDSGIPNNADKGQRASRTIATKIIELIGLPPGEGELPGQTTGNQFEACCQRFLERTFGKLAHLRPGKWQIEQISKKKKEVVIANYEQYSHLLLLSELAEQVSLLKSVLGTGYTIAPDVVVLRHPETDEDINRNIPVVGDDHCRFASLRERNNPLPIFHASVSCKWTLRSDRSQNARSEALTLLRNRKGNTPHICVATGEPTPSRLSSIALGTGDLDCVYHFALPELVDAVDDYGEDEAISMLNTLVEGKRLRDISDLPLDLAV